MDHRLGHDVREPSDGAALGFHFRCYVRVECTGQKCHESGRTHGGEYDNAWLALSTVTL